MAHHLGDERLVRGPLARRHGHGAAGRRRRRLVGDCRWLAAAALREQLCLPLPPLVRRREAALCSVAAGGGRRIRARQLLQLLLTQASGAVVGV